MFLKFGDDQTTFLFVETCKNAFKCVERRSLKVKNLYSEAYTLETHNISSNFIHLLCPPISIILCLVDKINIEFMNVTSLTKNKGGLKEDAFTNS